MEDKDKFLAEWQKLFPSEEPPDINFFNAVNFLTIRGKISECEQRIKDLELAVRKENFILNWLVTVDIEISVLGNVGVSENSRTPGALVWANSFDRPNGEAILGESSSCDQDNPDGKEENVTASKGNVEDKEARSSASQVVSHAIEEKEVSVAGGISSVDKSEQPTSAISPPRTNHVDECHSSIINDQSRIPVSVSDDDSPAYENVFSPEFTFSSDDIKQHTDIDQEEEASSKHRDLRRAGGSWSVYVKKEADNEGVDGSSTEQTAEDQININQEKESKPVPMTRDTELFTKKQSAQPEEHIYEEVTFLEDNKTTVNKNANDNVTVNLLYEEHAIKGSDDTEDMESEEIESIYENIDFLARNRLDHLTMGTDGSDNTSDYDSENGHNENEDSSSRGIPSPSFRNMTDDEIERLRKGKSDEDLHHLPQDLGKHFHLAINFSPIFAHRVHHLI